MGGAEATTSSDSAPDYRTVGYYTLVLAPGSSLSGPNMSPNDLSDYYITFNASANDIIAKPIMKTLTWSKPSLGEL